MSLILAIDQGTSSSRGIVFDLAADGSARIRGDAQRTFDAIFPQDGWVEQDPEVLWQTTLDASREAIANAGIEGRDIAAIGITNQRETTLVWDKQTGQCVYNAIVWQDRRTADRCQQMRDEGMAESVSSKTGLVLDPYFSGTKLAWLLDERPGLRQRAANGELCFGTVDTFLLWRLTKGLAHLTDATNASRTLLFDISEQRWDSELLRYFDIPATLMPEVCDSAHGFGMADAEWFGAEIPVTGIAGDQQAALVGQGCLNAGMCKSTYGTGCFLMANTGQKRLRSDGGLLTTVGYRLSGEVTYALEGSIFAAGVAVKWLRDRLQLIDDAAETETLARDIDGDTGGVYVVPAFTGLGAPHWNPNVRGTITGLTLDSSRAQIVTATLQSVAFQTAELLAAMAHDGAVVEQLGVDGGMVVNDWLCQFLADILNVTVERPVIIQTTALGAANLAALGAGLVPALNTRMRGLDRVFVPSMEDARRQALLVGWQGALVQALAGN